MPSGVCVVHTAENAPDTVGPDTGAEGVASFIQGRSDFGSYHDLCDSDSIIDLVPYDAEAYGDGTGSNPHAYHVSGATQADRWASMPPEWREAVTKNMAKAAATYAKWLKANHDVTIPAKRITRAESEARKPGFLGHGERDPGRRHDPGSGFMWALFLATYRDLMDPPTRPKKVQRTIEELKIEVERIKAAREFARRKGENTAPYTAVLKDLWAAQRRARKVPKR